MSNFLLNTYLTSLSTVSRMVDSIHIDFAPRSLDEINREEDGAETVQVIMIMGIMAVIIGAIFFVGGLKDSIIGLGEKVVNCVKAVTGTGSCSA